jgi:glycosyltransferase involved in cell wall biosynthesis
MAKANNKNILVITYWDFNEAHVQANVLPNLKMLSKVASESTIYLFCLNKKPLSKEEEAAIHQKLAPYRIRLLWFHYSHFGLKMILKFGWLIPYLCYTVFSKRIGQVYAWCTTAGAIGYLVSVFTGQPLTLESYEPHAEAMLENGYWKKNSYGYRILSFFEKKQAQRAKWVIAANKGMREYVQKRYRYSIPVETFFAKPACVDLEQFKPDNVVRNNIREELGYGTDTIVCLYAGKFGGIYLEKETFEFLKVAYDHWGDKFRILLLTSQDKHYIKEKCDEAGLPFDIIRILFVAHPDVPRYMQAGDFAICPVKPVPTKKYCTPVKDGEYWAIGLPVVITTNISDDSDIIRENGIGAVLNDLSAKSYAEAVTQIDNLLRKDKQELRSRIRAIASQYRNYSIAEKIYILLHR